MPLTGKQKRFLRSRGQTMEPLIHVGKDGVTEATVAATEEVLRKYELIKVRVLRAAGLAADEAAEQLAAATASEIAGRVGHTFLLFRANPELEHPLALPPAREGGGAASL